MKGLFIKDIRLFLGTRNLLVVLVGLFLLITGDTPYMGISYTLFILVFLTISLISYDEFDNGMTHLMTLPGGRKAYVTERYVFTLLTTTVSAVLLFSIAVLLLMIRGDMDGIEELILTTIIMYSFSNLFCSLVIPFMIKFGAEKGRFVMIGLCGLVYLGIFLISDYIEKAGTSLIFSSELIQTMENLSLIQISALFIGISILVVSISWTIAQKVMAKKEF